MEQEYLQGLVGIFAAHYFQASFGCWLQGCVSFGIIWRRRGEKAGREFGAPCFYLVNPILAYLSLGQWRIGAGFFEAQKGGVVRMLRRVWTVCVFLVIFAGFLPAYSSEISFLFDLNTPESDFKPQALPHDPDLKSGVAIRINWFAKNSFDNVVPYRFGFVLGIKTIKDLANSGRQWPGKYSAFRIQCQGDMRLWGNEVWTVRGGSALGLDFLSNKDPCDLLFCDFPSPVVLVSPIIRTTVKISPRVLGVFEIIGDLYLSSNEVIFPFESGIVFSGGISIIRW